MKSIVDQVREATDKIKDSIVFNPLDPIQFPEWFEIQPIRVAVNRLTGERIFLDPTDGKWRYLPTKES